MKALLVKIILAYKDKDKKMQTFIADIIPKIQEFSQKLDDLTLLTNQHWVIINDIDKVKNVYIFRRNNNELIISTNGKVETGKWEYLGNKTLLVERPDGKFLFKHGFFDENILALKIDGKDEYAFLANENKYDGGELNSSNKILDFLSKKYLSNNLKGQIQSQTGLQVNIAEKSNVYATRMPNEEEVKLQHDTAIYSIFTVVIVFFIVLCVHQCQ